ncbi:pilus assembly protein N-terminal domain-containing protein [Antarcticirhabdus aurantiaca]|uniref:Pilus assembly protein N-terminal domain-containing protein n=1 Tax=Antarcticirhabdus aurantiaca TaxID=2606717 RepID=A0ACD4NTM9_9HYPH|nr:pilus assembly protein N-terminal domain-containing protein [Antarcticirhabdus aurantiaca]WAJ30123.1 pilus assembly protein N-terminal domain-containing protein [Jeongeuplla avenae]
MRWSLRLTLPAAALACLVGGPIARAEAPKLEVEVDHARILKISEPAETIIIGNPSIVDVSVHDSHTLILTGRSYGITNLIVIGRDGEPILDESVSVRTFEEGTVRVFRQASRSTYSCSPNCEPTVTIGDDSGNFNMANTQFQARQTMATGGN